jgi:uncharacterized membrane protein
MSNRFSTIADLLVVLLLLGMATAVTLKPPGIEPLRVALVLPVLVFLPGYALVSALYPELPRNPTSREKEGWSLAGLERVGLAVAASVAIVPLIAFVLNFTPYGVAPTPVLGGILLITVPLTLLAAARRFRLDPDRRFHLPMLSRFRRGLAIYFTERDSGARQRWPFEAKNSRQLLLNLVLVVAVLTLLGSVAYAAVGPDIPSQDADYTEFYLLDENGEYLLGTETQLSGGGSVPAIVAIENHEDRELTYTVVVQRQQVSVAGNQTTVESRSVVDTVEVTVGNGATAELPRTFEGGDESTRVQVLLYRGDPPDNPTAENAYRVTRFWPAGNPTEGQN